VSTPTDTDVETLRDEMLRALVKGDAALAELIALDAVTTEGVSVTTLYVDVLAPVLAEIGHRWEGGALSVADEHLATGIAHSVMRLVGRAATRRPRRSRERVLLAAVGGESHVVGLRMIADLAEGAGFDVRYLGSAVPVGTLSDIVAKHEPQVVGLSVTMAASAEQLAEAIDEILGSGHDVRGVLVGGAGVPHGLRDDERVRYAPDARQAMEVIEELAPEPD
jgi:methanogenic corrinoid protein MtbC1